MGKRNFALISNGVVRIVTNKTVESHQLVKKIHQGDKRLQSILTWNNCKGELSSYPKGWVIKWVKTYLYNEKITTKLKVGNKPLIITDAERIFGGSFFPPTKAVVTCEN